MALRQKSIGFAWFFPLFFRFFNGFHRFSSFFPWFPTGFRWFSPISHGFYIEVLRLAQWPPRLRAAAFEPRGPHRRLFCWRGTSSDALRPLRPHERGQRAKASGARLHMKGKWIKMAGFHWFSFRKALRKHSFRMVSRYFCHFATSLKALKRHPAQFLGRQGLVDASHPQPRRLRARNAWRRATFEAQAYRFRAQDVYEVLRDLTSSHPSP